MIVLDTNVLSEALRPEPDARAMAWLAAQPRSALFTSTITRAELFYGIRLLSDGQRKAGLLGAVRAILDVELAGQVLGFDNDAADAYAELAAARNAAGKPISQFDAMIAAIAHSRGAILATRNVKDFVDCGVTLVDPWTARS